MARSREPVCRQCRREGMKLFLKGDRCYTDKCAYDRRSYAPGEHGQARRRKMSDYGIQLREKQRAKRIYGVLENQFRKYFKTADRMKGVTGENLLLLLERRMDNMVYRMGFARSRNHARQLVRHGHFMINGKKTDIPSYLLRQGDAVTIVDGSRKVVAIVEAMEAVERRGVPEWLMLEKDKFQAKVMAYPTRDQIGISIQEQLIVELYSK